VQSCTLQITNALGMHARAAARFVRIASAYESRIQVVRDERTMDGKSILGLLLLAAAHGTFITVFADGPDEAEALEALSRLVEHGFEEQVALERPSRG
jgi:phosphocarrier protein